MPTTPTAPAPDSFAARPDALHVLVNGRWQPQPDADLTPPPPPDYGCGYLGAPFGVNEDAREMGDDRL